MSRPTTRIEFLGCAITAYAEPPDDRVWLDVIYFAEFLRDADGQCAFCHGDPCAEQPCKDCGGDYMQSYKPDAGPYVWRYIPHEPEHLAAIEGNPVRLICREFMACQSYAPFETCPCCEGRPS